MPTGSNGYHAGDFSPIMHNHVPSEILGLDAYQLLNRNVIVVAKDGSGNFTDPALGYLQQRRDRLPAQLDGSLQGGRRLEFRNVHQRRTNAHREFVTRRSGQCG